MRVSEFDFDLPESLIALHPVVPRDAARMLHVNGQGQLSDRHVGDLVGLLNAGDVLVINETRVLPAALNGMRIRGQYKAAISFNLHKRINNGTWAAFARPAKRLKAGDRLVFGEEKDRACAAQTRSWRQLLSVWMRAGRPFYALICPAPIWTRP